MSEVKVISKTYSQGKNRWRLNADNSWSTLMFGNFINSTGLEYRWVSVRKDQVPKEVLKEQEGE